MTDVILPDLTPVPLTLESGDAARHGAPPGGDPFPPPGGWSGTGLPQLTGRVALGGPMAVPLRAEDVTDDPDLRTFIEREAAHSAYHLVHLSVSFAPTPETPRLEDARVGLALSSPEALQQPVAWSMAPRLLADTTEVTTSVRLAPQVKLAMLGEVSVGELERGTKRGRREVTVEAVGEMRSDPAWHLYRTASTPLRGTHRLVLVVRAARGAATRMSVSVDVTTRGRFLRRFTHTSGGPIRFSATL